MALIGGERAVDGQRPGDVGGVQRAVLDAHVEQDQLARASPGRSCRSSAGWWRAGRPRRSTRSRCRCRPPGPGGRTCPRASARRARAPWPTRARSPRSRGWWQSTASCSCSTSHSSLTSRISDRKIASSSSCVGVGLVGQQRVDVGVDAAVQPSRTARRQHLGQVVDVPAREAEQLLGLDQRAAPARPGLAVAAVAPERVVALGVPWPEEQRRLAVVDDEHGIGRLVAGEVDVCGVDAEPVVGVVGARLEAAGRYDDPLAGEALAQRLAASAAPTARSTAARPGRRRRPTRRA